MPERARPEPQKETIGKGELLYLHHPETAGIFSGYGLTVEPNRPDNLVGLLMVDRPRPADPAWLARVEETFGECQLVPMTASGDRGLACQMRIEPDSVAHLRSFPTELSGNIQQALEPLLEEPPAPRLKLGWDGEAQAWRSEFLVPNELPQPVREVFEQFGYGCLAVEAEEAIVHVCHAPDADIEGFRDSPVRSQWQLIRMPTAPLIRLEMDILDRPENPYRFESFLNVAAEDQAQVLAELANQEELYLAFYGDDLSYRYTVTIPHGEQQWQQLDEIVAKAVDYWRRLPADQRDFDQAKADFMRHFN